MIQEPPLALTVTEFQDRVDALPRLYVPPLPIPEATAQVQVAGFVNRVSTELQPLQVPPFPAAELAAATAAVEAETLRKATLLEMSTTTLIDKRGKVRGG